MNKSKAGGGYLAVPAKKYKKLRIDDYFAGVNGHLDQSVLSPKAAAISYNFDFSGGALKDGSGVEGIGITGLIVTNIWRFVKNVDNIGEIIMFTAASGDIFYIKNDIQSLGIRLSGRVYTANYRLYGSEAIIMWGENGSVAVWDGVNAAYFITDSLKIKSMDICGGLAFIAQADGESVRYTDELDPVNWNTGYSGGDEKTNGILTPSEGSGRIGKVVSFLGYLYVFKDYGVSRIAISGGVPKAAGNCIFGGRIFFDTVTLCGGKIMFLSSDGLYEFYGLDAKRVLSNLAGIKPSASACAAYFGGKYYLAARYDWGDLLKTGCETGSYTNNALISYCLADGCYTLSRGMDITRIVAADEAVYVVCGGTAGRLIAGAACFGTPLLKCWKSPLSDFSSEKTKVLKEVYIDTSGAVALTLDNGDISKKFSLQGSPQPQKIRTAFKGQKISFGIESGEAGARIGRIVLLYGEADK